MRNAIAIICFSFLLPALAAPESPPPPHEYSGDLSLAVKIGNDLYQTLDAKFQGQISPEAVSTIKTDVPEITPFARDGGNKSKRQVLISTGYVNLINHIAHAKAIDAIQPGYFQQYVSNLGRTSDGESLPDPPNMVDPRYWTDAVMNDQASYFNQMMGITMAINLSHLYLGHYQKYAGEMLAGKFAPINNFIAPAEWDASVKAATVNSLDCALAPGGAEALFAAIGNMPRRPAWTGYIVPLNVNIGQLNVQLAGYEADYFRGGARLHRPDSYLTVSTNKLVVN